MIGHEPCSLQLVGYTEYCIQGQSDNRVQAGSWSYLQYIVASAGKEGQLLFFTPCPLVVSPSPIRVGHLLPHLLFEYSTFLSPSSISGCLFEPQSYRHRRNQQLPILPPCRPPPLPARASSLSRTAPSRTPSACSTSMALSHLRVSYVHHGWPYLSFRLLQNSGLADQEKQPHANSSIAFG